MTSVYTPVDKTVCRGIRSPAMTAPTDHKSLRVRAETHARILALAAETGATVDETLARLLGDGVVHVPVSTVMQQRWTEVAEANGMPLPEFVRARVEGSFLYGGDAIGLKVIHKEVTDLARDLHRRTQPPRPPR